MNRFILVSLLLVLSNAAVSGPISEQFRGGVNGAAWGASIDDVVGMFPPGDHVFANTRGERAYWVKDGLSFLNVPRDGQGTLFGFNESDVLSSVTLGFQYERKDQVLGALISVFGAPDRTGTQGTKNFSCWKADAKIDVCFWVTRQAKHGISWLSVYGSNYVWRRKAEMPSNTSLERTREK
jgi:hypothetical protein